MDVGFIHTGKRLRAPATLLWRVAMPVRSARETTPGLGLFSAIAVAVTAAVLATSRPAEAMPNFAQAYGVACSECHVQIPALNAYGRWVQRTG